MGSLATPGYLFHQILRERGGKNITCSWQGHNFQIFVHLPVHNPTLGRHIFWRQNRLHLLSLPMCILAEFWKSFRELLKLSGLCGLAGSSICLLANVEPAGKEERRVVIKSAYEVEGTRWFWHDKPRDPSTVVYQMNRDIARGLRQGRKMKGL